MSKEPNFNSKEELDEFLETWGLDRLLQSYTAVIQSIAERLWQPQHESMAGVMPDDYVAKGLDEVVGFVDTWIPGVSSFKSYVLGRLRFRMLDLLRENSRIPRLALARLQRFAEVEKELMQNLGRQPRLEEVLETLNWSMEFYLEVESQAQFHSWSQITKEKRGIDFDRNDHCTLETISMVHGSTRADAEFVTTEGFRRIFRTLPQYWDKVAFYLYFCLGHKMHEVGHTIGVSESRCSQAISSYFRHLSEGLNIDPAAISNNTVQDLIITRWEQLSKRARQSLMMEFNLTTHFPETQRNTGQHSPNITTVDFGQQTEISISSSAIFDNRTLCLVFDLEE